MKSSSVHLYNFNENIFIFSLPLIIISNQVNSNLSCSSKRSSKDSQSKVSQLLINLIDNFTVSIFFLGNYCFFQLSALTYSVRNFFWTLIHQTIIILTKIPNSYSNFFYQFKRIQFTFCLFIIESLFTVTTPFFNLSIRPFSNYNFKIWWSIIRLKLEIIDTV